MNEKENLLSVKEYISDLYRKLDCEDVLDEVDEKVINYIEFVLNLNKKNRNFTQVLHKYHSQR